VKAEIQYLKQL